MQLQDNTSLQVVELANGLIWIDEFDWTPVESNVSYSLTGAQIIEQGTKQAGRPISLSPPDDTMGWMMRADLMVLKTWAQTAGRRMTLTINGDDYQVMFASGNPITAKPAINLPVYGDTDPFVVNLKFIEV